LSSANKGVLQMQTSALLVQKTLDFSKFMVVSERTACYQNVMHYSAYRGKSIECDV